ncbi:hypothetical protein D1872_50310 [compost metagenome]
MTGFVTTPVTLRKLLTHFKSNGEFPRTRNQLYEIGCLELCAEPKRKMITAPFNTFQEML